MPYFNGNFSGKRLKSLPSELLQKGQDVDKADLQKNRLKDVIGISRLSNLTELNLCRNELVDFPKEISELQQLVRLYINQNNIKSIPDNILPSLKKLEFLKMSTNKLSQLPSDMNKCESLIYLNLSNNFLRDLQPLVGLGQLKELYVENNKLTELSQALFQSNNLEKFKVNNNPLRMPPETICEGGLKSIQNYFEMLKASSFTTRTIKTMFLGSSGAGKSTVCRSLWRGKPVEVAEDDRTVGIEIQQFLNKDGVRFFFWDFAGQEEYYFTHHVFITSQAFVILAVDLSMYDAKSFKEKVGFWINNIQLKVPNAVVLLVGTHVDCCSDNEVLDKKSDIEEQVNQMLSDRNYSLEQQRKNLEELEDSSLTSDQIGLIKQLEEYKLQILDLIAIDCKKPEDIKRLQDYINKVILDKNKFPFMEQTLPQCYKDVEDAIQAQLEGGKIPEHGIVTHEDILAHLNTSHNELNHEKLSDVLQYLHRTGIIIWYSDIKDLKDMVFVKPSFLISLFKAIVRHDLVCMLQKIPSRVLKMENALDKHRDTWIKEFQHRATLSNVAIRILVHAELKLSCVDDDELIEEIVGTKKKAGNLIKLLQHFDVCLPAKRSARLNPTAPEFHQGKKWVPSSPDVYEPNGTCLFPSFLQKENEEVMEMWGENNLEDITVQVYFLPEIPHGFFHRLIIRIYSIYFTYWIGKDRCLFTCGNKRFLLREQAGTAGDQYIEIRGKHSDMSKPTDLQIAWDIIKEMMKRLAQLTQQWRGLCQYVHIPCKHIECDEYFEWTEWQDWIDSNAQEKSNMHPEDKMTCRKGHTRRTELLFPPYL